MGQLEGDSRLLDFADDADDQSSSSMERQEHQSPKIRTVGRYAIA